MDIFFWLKLLLIVATFGMCFLFRGENREK